MILTSESAPFTVTPPYSLAIRPLPVVLTGEPFALEVEVREDGVIAPDAELEISLALASGPGALLGDVVETSVAGVARFSGLLLHVPGAYVFKATATTEEIMALSETVDVAPGMVPIFASPEGEALRIFFSLPVDGAFAPLLDPASYSVAVDGIGPLEVVAVELAGPRSVRLLLADAPPPTSCTVTLAEGAARSTTGALSAAASLAFEGEIIEGDVTPPEISHFDPAPGSPISRERAISFTATDNVLLRRILVVVFQGGRGDLAHDGDAFLPPYEGTRQAVPGGFRYTVSRRGGWITAPRVRIYAIDQAGNEAA